MQGRQTAALARSVGIGSSGKLSRSLGDVSSKLSLSHTPRSSSIRNEIKRPQQQQEVKSTANGAKRNQTVDIRPRQNGGELENRTNGSSLSLSSFVSQSEGRQQQLSNGCYQQPQQPHKTEVPEEPPTSSSMPRSRIPVPVTTAARRSSSKPRRDDRDPTQPSFALRRFDSGVDLATSLSPTGDCGNQFVDVPTTTGTVTSRVQPSANEATSMTSNGQNAVVVGGATPSMFNAVNSNGIDTDDEYY
jgi:hypothetical protein